MSEAKEPEKKSRMEILEQDFNALQNRKQVLLKNVQEVDRQILIVQGALAERRYEESLKMPAKVQKKYPGAKKVVENK